MEKNIYEDDFEQLLRDSADNFRMYPSKWVWNSIYNNLHPGRKWPSLAILLFFFSSIILIGLSNRQPERIAARNIASRAGSSALLHAVEPSHNVSGKQGNLITADAGNESGNNTIVSDNPSATHGILQQNNDMIVNRDSRPVLHNDNTSQLLKGSAKPVSTHRNTSLEKKAPITDNDEGAIVSSDIIDTRAVESTSVTTPSLSMDDQHERDQKPKVDSKSSEEKTDKDLSKLKTNNQLNEKGWIEDFAFHNKPNTSKWRSKVKYQFYLTPSLGYRVISKNTPLNMANSSSLITTGTVRNYEDAVSQAAAVNMELGGNLLYGISKKFNLKIGIQFNYTNYDINAYELKHPAIATLLLNNPHTGRPELVSRSTNLVNTEGIFSTKLKNNTYQVSLPIGADLKLAGNQQLKWFVGATIQPTFIADGNAYLLSYDYKNYVADNSIMRKWNLNAGVETFISYKTKSGITLNAGPQFRYQLLSTYRKEYTYDEKLYNVGLKIGIITRF